MTKRRAKAPSKRAMSRRMRRRAGVWIVLAAYAHLGGFVRVWGAS